MITAISNMLRACTSCCSRRKITPQDQKIQTLAKTCLFDLGSPVINKQRVWGNQSFHVLADYAPIVPGHLLLVPKRHFVKAHEMNTTEVAGEMLLRKRIVKVYAKIFNIKEDEVEYIELRKNGGMAGQSVSHCHLHIIPIRKGTFLAKLNIMLRLFFGHKKDPNLQGTVQRLQTAFRSVDKELERANSLSDKGPSNKIVKPLAVLGPKNHKNPNKENRG